MASRPMQRALNRKIAELGREKYGTYTDEDGEEQFVDPDGELWVFEQISTGVRVGKIAASIDLGEPYGSPSRRLLYFWRDDGGDQRRELWRLAMEAAADEMMEASLEEAEDLVPDTGHVAAAKHKLDVRRAIAARQAPEAWGKKSIGEEIAGGVKDLGQGLLAALMDYGHPDAPGMRRIREAEVLSIEEHDE